MMSAVEKRETSNDELAGNSREAGGVRSALSSQLVDVDTGE